MTNVIDNGNDRAYDRINLLKPPHRLKGAKVVNADDMVGEEFEKR